MMIVKNIAAVVLALGFSVATARAESEFLDRPAYYLEPLKMMQIVNPADKAEKSKADLTKSDIDSANAKRRGTWEAPAVKVVGQKPSDLVEEDRIGTYEQPRWTADRRFPGTRTYVIPENKIEFEYWLRPTIPRSGPTKFKSLYEIEVGLPYRFQLDLYYVMEWKGNGGPKSNGQSVEIRYALADWDKIWGNPTLYFEYTFADGEPDLFETKLLFTGEICPRWHWGANLSYETELAGSRNHEYKITGGISYTLIDQKLSVGAEFEAQMEDKAGSRGKYDKALWVGPSIQWRPLPQIHLDFAPLIGVTGDSPAARIYLVFGYEF